jgi:hypothetical protein
MGKVRMESEGKQVNSHISVGWMNDQQHHLRIDCRRPHQLLISLFVSLSLSSIMASQKITAKNPGLKPTVKVSKGTMGVVILSAHNESDASEEESEDDENSGVDEEGLEKLMNALGEDGLDEFDLAQLRMLTGSAAGEEDDGEAEERSSDDEEDDADATNASTDEEEKEEGKSKGEEEIALDDEDVDSVDEDAIPRRKVEIDNKVRLLVTLSIAS